MKTENLKKIIKKEYLILAVIIILAIFLRSYHFVPFLGFHLDQSRDAIIVGDFVSYGFSKIPLLGPHASGSTLQLGPAYYYLQSIPVFFLGQRPETFALSDWFFSILFIPLLYIFLRLYFSRITSLLLSAIATASLFLVIYGRFASNPNSLPFFTLLALFGLLKADWKNTVHPRWFYLGIFSAAIATQLHYVYFFIAPVLIIVYIAVWKPRLKIKHYLIGLLITLAVYFPMIISEIKTGGANTQILIKNTLERGVANKSKHNIIDKAFYAYQKLEIVNWQIITSDEHGSSMQLSKKLLPVCSRQCRKDLPFLILQTFLFVFGLWASISFYRRERDRERKKFIFSIWLWLGLMFIISIPIIYNMSSRYYLAATAPLFVLLGMTLDKIKDLSGKHRQIAVILLPAAIILFNLRSDFIYFREHAAMAKGEVENTIGREIFNDKKVTLEQEKKVVEYIKKRKKSNVVVRIAADNSFARAIFYLLKYQENIPACYVKTSSFHPSGSLDYFLVYRLSVNQEIPQDLNEQFSIRGQEKTGNLLIIDAQAKNPGGQTGENEICSTYL